MGKTDNKLEDEMNTKITGLMDSHKNPSVAKIRGIMSMAQMLLEHAKDLETACSYAVEAHKIRDDLYERATGEVENEIWQLEDIVEVLGKLHTV